MCQCLPKCQVKSTGYCKVVTRQSHTALATIGWMLAVTPGNRSRAPKSVARCFPAGKTNNPGFVGFFGANSIQTQ